MIDYIRGELVECTPAAAVIETQGVGYMLNISLNTYSQIEGLAEAKLYVYEAIREDAIQLYGFFDKEERELFLLLITVPGIGGNTARMILSAFSPAELCDAIAAGNERLLKSVKGIGLKTAQRIIVDLQSKIKGGAMAPAAGTTAQMALQNEVMDGAVAALVMLGFQQAASAKAVQAILKNEPDAAVEKVIKLALKML